MTAPCLGCGEPVLPAFQTEVDRAGPYHVVCETAARVELKEKNMIDVLWLGGTGWGRGGDGISDHFAKFLDHDRFRFRFVEYPATYGVGMSYAESLQAGKWALLNAIRDDRPVILGGYSQGAAAAGAAAETWSRRGSSMPVLGCALIADPLRPEGAGMPGWGVASGYGIAGRRPIERVPTWWAAVEGDPITSLPAGNPLRSVADMTEFMSLDDPVKMHQWGQKLVERAVKRQWQRWWSIENWQTWGGAVAYARGYLADHRHTDDYVLYGHAQRLAEVVNEVVS